MTSFITSWMSKEPRRGLFIVTTVLLALCCVGSVCSIRCCQRPSVDAPSTISQQQPIIIGHRGAPSHCPEHTLVSYELAIDLGADFIEIDLVPTKDHVLIARHENDLSFTTDVSLHAEFADLKVTKEINGVQITGWFTEDFTLDEIKTLRVMERMPNVRPQNTPFDALYDIPTLEEVVQLAKNRSVGIYPETKHPTYFANIGLPLEEVLVDVLEAYGFVSPEDKVFIQSFEAESLMKLRNLTQLPLIQLIEAHGPNTHNTSENLTVSFEMTSQKGLAEIATYAQGIGPDKTLLFIKEESGNDTKFQATTLVEDAHKLNLLVHPWTFRNENKFLAEGYQLGNSSMPDYQRSLGNSPAEYCDYFCIGIDGLFTDHADTAAAIRSKVYNPCLGA